MKGRRGTASALEIIVGFVIALFALALILYLTSSSNRNFIDALSCNTQGDSGLIEVPKSPGCQASLHQSMYLRGFFGTHPGHVCCEITNYDPNDPSTWQGGSGADGGATPSAVSNVKATSLATGKTLAEGQTIVLYASSAAADKGLQITGDVVCPKTVGCGIWCQESLLTSTGADASGLLTSHACDGGNLHFDSQAGAKGFTGPLAVKPDAQYADQTLTYTLAIGKDDKTVKTYTLRFRIDTPIKYAGVTQQWSKRKDITAACTSPVECSDILFMVKDTSANAKCDPGDIIGKEQVTLKTTYCMAKDGALIGACDTTFADCTKRIQDENDAEYSSAYSAIIAAANEGLIPDNVAYAFSTQQGTHSTYTCIKSVDKAASGSTVYRVPVDPTNGRAAFTLDQAAFENKLLCVYGKDRNAQTTSDAGPAQPTPVYYVAKGPARLMLDVTPPTAVLDFRPASLQLRFACTDNPGGSGCKDTFGIAYVNDVGKFLRALVSKNTPQNAAAWCPPYASAAGYSGETRPIVQYNEREVRVLCLRVEDNAGNAGIALANVYNGYDLFAKALAEAIKLHKEGKV